MLDPKDPISIGAMVGPDAFTEVRFLQHYKQTLALRLIPELAAEFKTRFGRDTGGLLRTYQRRGCGNAGGRHGFDQRHHQGRHR